MFIIIQLYNLIFILILPIVLLKFLYKSIKLKAYKERLNERLGIFNFKNKIPQSTCNIWIHAVSVGEIMASIPMIKKLKSQLPEVDILFTCTTPRGSEIIQQKLAELVVHVYFPLDISFAINNFLITFKPKILIILEKELWPNLIWHCNKNKIFIIIVNAQLSNRSYKKYLLIKPLIKPLLSTIYKICAQTKFDAYKFKQLTFKENHHNIITIGNIKFDINASTTTSTSIINTSVNNIVDPVWIAASTHPIEEDLILEAHKLILAKLVNTVLILVPRHPERINFIIKSILKSNFTYQQHSLYSSCIFLRPIFNSQVYVVDTIGELNKFYQISQVAFVGGSLVPHIGGHNVLEPAMAALPIIVGPYTTNCQQIITNLKFHNGLKIVKSAQQLATQILVWLNNKKLRLDIGNNAKNYLIAQTGATDRIVKIILNLFETLV